MFCFHGKNAFENGPNIVIHTLHTLFVWLGSTVAVHLFQLCKFEQKCCSVVIMFIPLLCIGMSNSLARELNSLRSGEICNLKGGCSHRCMTWHIMCMCT